MTSEGLGEMFEGDSADTCAGKFLLVSMGGRADGLACADPGARTPIGASGNLSYKELLPLHVPVPILVQVLEDAPHILPVHLKHRLYWWGRRIVCSHQWHLDYPS